MSIKRNSFEIKEEGLFLDGNKLESVISYTLSQNAGERTAELQITMNVETLKDIKSKHNEKRELVHCAFCKKTILESDKYCQYCGKPTGTIVS